MKVDKVQTLDIFFSLNCTECKFNYIYHKSQCAIMYVLVIL